MRRDTWRAVFCAAVLMAACAAKAQRTPGVGYIYPAGGRQGTTFEAVMAGRFLDGVTGAVVDGEGVEVTLIEHVKPLNGKQINLLRDRQKELQEMLKQARSQQRKGDAKQVENEDPSEPNVDVAAVQAEMADIRKKLANPKNRNRDNPQLAEDVRLQVSIAADATPGRRQLRLRTAAGLSNPVAFHVGQMAEVAEKETEKGHVDAGEMLSTPVVINGRIMPGDVDRFTLRLRKGMRLVAAASARELIPYLADAVPGWFQATLALYGPDGQEAVYVDDYRFSPDPVLMCEVPTDGEYVLEIRDSIYRGREDFVYRIAVGALPFVTGVFPLGCRTGEQTTAEVSGWNLPAVRVTLDGRGREPGVYSVSVRTGELASPSVPFAVGELQECAEQEPNGAADTAGEVKLPMIVNGRIEKAGDEDVFRFEGHKGQLIVAEVTARRLQSPLDSVLRLTDASGKTVAFNDDHEDKAAGLTTHHADSFLRAELPADGVHLLRVRDAQDRGGAAFAYRLRISPPQPDFELRVTPSTLNARSGAGASVIVHALRREGFDGEITLSLRDAPQGFVLPNNARIRAGEEQVKLWLRVPKKVLDEPIELKVEGRATIAGEEVCRLAAPADDLMQAFIYRHLVIADNLTADVFARGGNAQSKQSTTAVRSTAAPGRKVDPGNGTAGAAKKDSTAGHAKSETGAVAEKTAGKRTNP